MKKSIFLTLAAVVVLGLSTLTSCKGNKTESTEQKDSTAVQAATKEVKDSTTAKPAEEKPAATEEKK